MNIDKINKNNPFKVPENYFEDFTVKMIDKISESSQDLETKESPKIPVRKKISPFLYFAAMFVGIFLTSQVFMLINPSSKNNIVNINPSSSNFKSEVYTTDTYWKNIGMSKDEFCCYLEAQIPNDEATLNIYDILYNN